jgi:uracil-DNA glycosylase family 4
MMRAMSVWTGFLPENSIVMTRKRAATQQLSSRFKVEGNPSAALMFIAADPNEGAEVEGRPLSGPSGELLDKMIEAMGLSLNQVCIVNVLRNSSSENLNSELQRQTALVQPKVIVALGELALQALLETDSPLSQTRGRFQNYRGMKLMPTYHPSQLLRTPSSKKEAWSDLQQVMQVMKEL